MIAVNTRKYSNIQIYNMPLVVNLAVNDMNGKLAYNTAEPVAENKTAYLENYLIAEWGPLSARIRHDGDDDDFQHS